MNDNPHIGDAVWLRDGPRSILDPNPLYIVKDIFMMDEPVARLYTPKVLNGEYWEEWAGDWLLADVVRI